jgi:fido (protein-threonine AMPylation protein)/biotin operon repressor
MRKKNHTDKNRPVIFEKELEEYTVQSDPGQKARSYYWKTAIGLQAVDGIKPSEYLIATANENINGDITIDEAQARIESYYEARPATPDENRIEEADKVSARIAVILAEKTFSFSPVEYISIHRRLFDGIYKFAGKVRDYNFTKSEWVLHGATVYYTSAESIKETLDYDFSQEKVFNYKGLTMPQTVEHIARFISGLWQIHAFGEGNTRTTAVFAIKYLRSFGFDVTNDIFASNAWYFRNALVRANYNDLSKGIHATQEYLNLFFSNLVFGENNVLKNRELLTAPETVTADVGDNVGESACDVGEKLDIESSILAILKERPDLSAKKIAALLGKTSRTIERHIKELREQGLLVRVGADRGGHWKVREN